MPRPATKKRRGRGRSLLISVTPEVHEAIRKRKAATGMMTQYFLEAVVTDAVREYLPSSPDSATH